jgi:hypothetical protein
MNVMKRYLLLCVVLVAALAAGIALRCEAQGSTPAPGDFTGTWEGTIRVNCSGMLLRGAGRCNAVNKITLTIIQDGSKITGSYHCSIGTQICRNGNADDTGKITSGSASGNNLRLSILIPADVSNCYYNGFSPSPGKLRGGYSCYLGGGLAEQGMWEASRLGG